MIAEDLLSVSRLSMRFGGLMALNQVDLTVQVGERRALIGPNGAGKTTLFNVIGGELAPTGGRILFHGSDVTGAPSYRLAQGGLARTFQKNNLFRGLSVFENVRLAVQRRLGVAGRTLVRASAFSDVNQRTTLALQSVQLSGPERLARTLSYGEQRQLELAIALACEPDLLLLDEPTAGMSPSETEAMTALLRSLPRSLSILIIEHDMDVVFALADRITVLHYGQVLAEGSPGEVRASPAVREAYLGARA